MPRGDRTGPLGLGPMTGRRAGYCAGYNTPGFANPAVPRYGAGFGGRFGWRGMGYWGATSRWQYPAPTPLTPQQESESLKAEANWLRNQLDAIEKRIAELENR